MTYTEMLAGRGMKVGDQVVCQYRQPSNIQWWIHPFWVGVIEDASTDKESWNGKNSESEFCVIVKSVKVRYLPSGSMAGFTERDSLANLRQVHFGNVAESPYFADDQKYDLWAFACKCGMGDYYADTMHFPPARATVAA